MNTPRLFPAVALALLFAALPLSTIAAAKPGAEAVDEAWVKAFTASDVNAVMALYAKNAVLWLPNAPEARGSDAIRKSYEEFFAANAVKSATLSNTHYQTSGNLSVGWGEFTLVVSPKKGGEPMTMAGRFSCVVTKENGKWVYVVDHASAPAPAKPGI